MRSSVEDSLRRFLDRGLGAACEHQDMMDGIFQSGCDHVGLCGLDTVEIARMIIAQARVAGLPLITGDEKIQESGLVRTVWD